LTEVDAAELAESDRVEEETMSTVEYLLKVLSRT
jgi:hypothetical protein